MVTSPEFIFVDTRMCLRVLFFCLFFFFFVKLVFKVKTLNFKWVHNHLKNKTKRASWQNGAHCSNHPAQDLNHFMYRYFSVVSSPSASSNVCTCLPVLDLFVVERRNYLEPMYAEDHPSVTSHLLQASCCDISLLIGSINLYLVALH